MQALSGIVFSQSGVSLKKKKALLLWQKGDVSTVDLIM